MKYRLFIVLSIMASMTFNHDLALAQRRNQIITNNVSTAEELRQHIFNTGIIGVDSNGAPLYEADFSKMEPADCEIIDIVGYHKSQFINPRRISFDSPYFMELWSSTPNATSTNPVDWNNAKQVFDGQKGARLFISSYASSINNGGKVSPQSWRQRQAAVKPDRGRNYTLSTSLFNPRYFSSPNANMHFFDEDNLETEIPWDAPELNQPDIVPVPLMNNWSTQDPNLKPFLEIPKMNFQDGSN